MDFRWAVTLASPLYPGVSCGPALTGKAPLWLYSSLCTRMKADFEGDGVCMCDCGSDNCLQVLTTCVTNESGPELMCMWCPQLPTGY